MAVNCFVMHSERFGILCAARSPQILCSGQQWLDRFVSEYHQRGVLRQMLAHYPARPSISVPGQRFISARLPDPADGLLSPEFLQVIGGATGAILRFAFLTECPNLTS
jgi:hypothetical protein